MEGDTRERTQRRKKKKSRLGRYLYAVTVFLLTIINISLAIWLLTYVQHVRVKGNVNSEKSEVVEWVTEDPMTINSLYAYWKFKTGAYKLPVFLEDVDVRLTAPWKVEVSVQEKEIIGCVLHEEMYVYFDAEGLVLKEEFEFADDVPLIEGLEVESAGRFAHLTVKNEKVFTYIVNLTKEIEKKELQPNRIIWTEDSMDLYFGDICVKLGKNNYEVKLAEIPPILEKLEGKKGVLHMEYYEKGSTISFKENK